MNPLLKELHERGLISQTFGDLEAVFSKPTTFYIGLDPTADSLGVHHMVGLIAAKIMQKHGHRPIILVGGATCAIGDPSGKTEERKAISMEDVFHNVECVKAQISKILDFNDARENGAIMVNNYDWYRDYKFLDFLRDVGKKITVNYLMAKENVKNRISREGSGISFQEFSYGLLQGYDFVHLYKEFGCKAQIAGTDNLGNMVTGEALVHKMLGKDDVCGITWDLITCSDGRKFGKTEGNTVWLDPKKTTPYQFYQFWLNTDDADAERFIKLFTMLSKEEIDSLIAEHRKAPHLRLLQKRLAKEVTIMVHSEADYELAVEASNILFGNATSETLKKLDDSTILSVFDGVKKFNVEKKKIIDGIKLTDLTVVESSVFKSKGELRKLITNGGISINKEKVTSDVTINADQLVNDKFILVQQGKKTYTLIVAQ